MQGHHGDRPLLASQKICVPKSFSLLGRMGHGLGKHANGAVLTVSDFPSAELLPTRRKGEMRGNASLRVTLSPAISGSPADVGFLPSPAPEPLTVVTEAKNILSLFLEKTYSYKKLCPERA